MKIFIIIIVMSFVILPLLLLRVNNLCKKYAKKYNYIFVSSEFYNNEHYFDLKGERFIFFPLANLIGLIIITIIYTFIIFKVLKHNCNNSFSVKINKRFVVILKKIINPFLFLIKKFVNP